MHHGTDTPAEGMSALAEKRLVVQHEDAWWSRDRDGNYVKYESEIKEWVRQDAVPADVIRAYEQDAGAPFSPVYSVGRGVSRVIAVVVTLLVLLFGWAFVDANANIPVISPILCSMKGASWFEGSAVMGTPAGCYDLEEPQG
jgi:hypothetical protein